MARKNNLSGPFLLCTRRVGSGNENRSDTPLSLLIFKASGGGEGRGLLEREGGIKERNVRNKGSGGRGRVYKRAGSEKNLKL